MALCDDLEGWNAGVRGRPQREAIYVYIRLIHLVLQQKLAQYWKTTIAQFKKVSYLLGEHRVKKNVIQETRISVEITKDLHLPKQARVSFSFISLSCRHVSCT